MTRKAKTKKSTRVTKKDIFETALAIRMVFGEQPNEYRLEQTKTSVVMVTFSKESAEEALPHIQQALKDYECKAPVEVVVLLKTLTADSVEPVAQEKPETGEQSERQVENKLSEGLLAYLAQAAIPGNKGIDVSVHLTNSMTADELNEKLSALVGSGNAPVNDPNRTRAGFSSAAWVVRVKVAFIRRLNQADFITKVNRYYGEAEAYSANSAG